MAATREDQRPWEVLEQLIREPAEGALRAYIEELGAGDAGWALSRLAADDQVEVLASLDAETAATLFAAMPRAQASELADRLDPGDAARIFSELASDEQADILGDVDDDEAAAILRYMEPEDAEDARRLADFPEDVAGGLMAAEFHAYREDESVGGVVRDLRRKAGEFEEGEIQYVYVESATGRLAGVLRLRDLLFSPDDRRVGDIMIRDPLTVSTGASLEELDEFFDNHDFLGVPAVDADGRMRGVVRRDAVEEAVGGRAEADFLKSQGIIGGEEFRHMPLRVRSTRRLAWLSINIVLNIVAASVIALYQDTLSQVIALAIFLPIISDMSGCSGNQAIAVSLRELSLGLVKPYELLYVWLKEASIGLINGSVLGLLIGLVSWGWIGNPYLGLVVGGALAVNTLVAVSLGGVVPLLLRRFGQDPALASGPILTTVTDLCGFLFALSFATAMLPYLQTA